MLNCYFYMGMLLSLLSLGALVASISVTSKNAAKCVLTVEVGYIIALIIDVLALPGKLRLEVGLDVLALWLFAFVGGIIYIISMYVCSVKIEKMEKKDMLPAETAEAAEPAETAPDITPKKALVIAAAIIAAPVLILSFTACRELNFLRNSDLVLVYYSNGNGGFGDGEYFAYAVSDKWCKEVDIGVDIGGMYMKEFLSENVREKGSGLATQDNDITFGDYRAFITDGGIMIYKNGELIHEKSFAGRYYNIEFAHAFLKE